MTYNTFNFYTISQYSLLSNFITLPCSTCILETALREMWHCSCSSSFHCFMQSFFLLVRVLKNKREHCFPCVSIFSVTVSTAYVDKIVFQELGIPVLVSSVVKQALGRGSNNLYVVVCPQDWMPDQYHQESLEYQMRNCYVQKERLEYLCGIHKSPLFQINIFEHLYHVDDYFFFPFQFFSLHLLHHYRIYPAKKHFEIRPLWLLLLGIFLR